MQSPSPSRRMKLVLPNLTPAMQQDLALSKGSSGKGSKPLSIGTRPEYTDYPLIGIVTPHPNDVLCGRGGGSNNHPGNESFRELVNEVKFPYVNCPKREKPLIARRIVEAVRNQTPPGRFLSKDSKTGLWNDIGDGKAREKTSQALREGAPIIRDMILKPTSPTNVAHVLKEAKKAERAEKEYGVKLSKAASPDKNDDASLASMKSNSPHDMHPEASSRSHSLPMPERKSSKHKRHESLGSNNSPHNLGPNHSAPLLPLKKFRSLGEKDIRGAHDISSSAPSHGHPSALWHHMPQQQPPPPRNFGIMSPYSGHSGHPAGHMMGGYAPPPPRGPVDYPSSGMPPRHLSSHDSVPIETVRRLLLGQLDPVQFAMKVLSPEEAVMVARRHVAAGGLQHLDMMGRGPVPMSGQATGPSRPPPLAPLVSDGSSTSSSGGSEISAQSIMQRTLSDQITGGAAIHPSAVGDDASSVDSSKQSNYSENSKRALPKKKRKYIEVKES